MELDERVIDDPAALAEAWADMRRCDEAALDALDLVDRHVFGSVVESSASRSRRRPSSRRPVARRVVRLHLALHRRIVFRRDLAPT